MPGRLSRRSSLLLSGDIESNPGPPPFSRAASRAMGPSLDDQVHTLQEKVGELATKVEAADKTAENAKLEFNAKLDNFDSKIDETLTESISVLKKDYETKVRRISLKDSLMCGI